MIRYRRTIQFKTNRNGELYLETDFGQTWRTLEMRGRTAMSDWLFGSAQTELQHWQKDLAKVVLDAFVDEIHEDGKPFPYTIYRVYQKGQGYQSTQSDVFLMRIPAHNIWYVSTSENTWIFFENLDNFPIFAEEAIGSVLDRNVRQHLYDWSDHKRGIAPNKIKYTDNDYQNKGIAP